MEPGSSLVVSHLLVPKLTTGSAGLIALLSDGKWAVLQEDLAGRQKLSISANTEGDVITWWRWGFGGSMTLWNSSS